jgi:rhamnosyltransferase
LTAGVSTAVYAVVVSYNATPARLTQQFQQLAPQVNTIVWVDNGSSAPLAANHLSPQPGRLHHIQLPHNLGIGAAQNVGMHWAMQAGATHILLMDDDSLPAPDMVSQLMHALATQPKAGAAGAAYHDPRRQESHTPFSVRQGFRLQWLPCTDSSRTWPVDHLIASGCLIPVHVLQAVGPMREDYFIDWVDVEWCLRATHHGYRLYGVCAAALEHTLGNRVTSILGREIPCHPPWRHYYQARNFILMLRHTPMPWQLRAHMAWRQLKRFLVFSTLVPGRVTYARMWVLGITHGCLGRTGPRVTPSQR